MEKEEKYSSAWIFHGVKGHFASAVFSSREKAEIWIKQKHLSGILTHYQIDIPAYDWAIENEYFIPKKEHHLSPEFIQTFSGGHEHYHYENGILE